MCIIKYVRMQECTDDSNLYFEPKDAAAELYVLGISPDVSFFQATETI